MLNKKWKNTEQSINSIYKIVFIAVFTGCIMLLAVVFISTHIFNQTRSLMYLDYIAEEYGKFNKKCETLIMEKEFMKNCEKCISDKRYISEIKYKLKDLGTYGSEIKIILTDRKGNIKFAENDEKSDLYICSFLKIVVDNAKRGEIPYHSIYKLRTYAADLVYTYIGENDMVINLFVERPVWERLFPKYRFDGVITGRNQNVIMMSREGFVADNKLNKFEIDKNTEKLKDYVVNSKVLADGRTKIYSMIYAPKNEMILLVGILIVIVFGSLWSVIVIKISMNMARESARAREELLHRNYIAEIRELTAQINPHFMYNTLEMIKYMIVQDGRAAGKIIEKFTKILRYSISSTEREILLAEDLNYIQDSIAIQEERFKERFKCSFKISEEAKNLKVMKLALQPIIENSIKYGFKKSMYLNVNIMGEKKENYLVLTVIDDGGGMEEEALEKLKEEIKESEVRGTHNGINNIARRLELKYKGKSGLSIANTENGFCVTLYIKQEEENV